MATNNGQAIYQGFLARGFNPAQAAALAGNVEQESSFNPGAWNARSQAGGLMQWRLDRLTGLQNYAQSTGRDATDPNLQMDYVVREMQGPEAKNSASFLQANDVPSANAALKDYVRYGNSESGNRLQNSLAIAGNAVKQYDANGNPVAPYSAPAPAAQTSAPKAATPAAPSPDDDALLAKYLGGASSGATSATAPDSTAPTSTADDALLAKYLGTATNGLGTTSAPGSAQYAADAVAALKAGKTLPQVSPTPPEAAVAQDVVPGAVRAFSENAVNAVPVLGPLAHNARNALMGPEGGAHMDALGQQASAANPIAAGAGTVFGTVAPLAAAGTTAVGGRLLGMTGSMASRMLMGAASGGLLSGADTVARGGNVQQAGQNALLGAGIGGALPIVGKIAGAAKDAFLGPSANKMVANALTADQNAPGQVNQLVHNLGPGATIADTGPNAQALAGGLASLPGEPQSILKNALTARAAGASDRLASDVATNLGNGQPIGALTDSIVASQKAAADPLYAAVRPKPVQMTPALQALGNTPLGKQAFQRASEMMANDGLSGTGTTVGFFDYAKQALDDITSSAQRAGENNAARQSTDMANTIKTEVDKQVPAYAQARAAFAGPAKVLDAVNLGQGVFAKTTSPEELQEAFSSMSPSERDGVLQGAQSAVQGIMGNAKNDATGVQQAFRTNFAKDKLAILIGQKPAQAISDAIDREATFAGTKNTVAGNSLTAARQAMQKLVSPETAVVALPPQTIQGMTIAALEKARNALTASYRNKQNIAAANMLMSGGSPQTAARLGAAAAPRNALLAPAAAPLLAKQGNVGIGNLLTWAQPDMPHIIVRGARPVMPGQMPGSPAYQ